MLRRRARCSRGSATSMPSGSQILPGRSRRWSSGRRRSLWRWRAQLSLDSASSMRRGSQILPGRSRSRSSGMRRCLWRSRARLSRVSASSMHRSSRAPRGRLRRRASGMRRSLRRGRGWQHRKAGLKHKHAQLGPFLAQATTCSTRKCAPSRQTGLWDWSA